MKTTTVVFINSTTQTGTSHWVDLWENTCLIKIFFESMHTGIAFLGAWHPACVHSSHWATTSPGLTTSKGGQDSPSTKALAFLGKALNAPCWGIPVFRCKDTKALLLMLYSPQTSMCWLQRQHTHVLLPSHTFTPFLNLCFCISAFDYLTVFFTKNEHEPEWYWLRDTLYQDAEIKKELRSVTILRKEAIEGKRL